MKLAFVYKLSNNKAALSEGTQRAVLVTGMELSLYMSNRLQVYLTIYAHARPPSVSAIFRQVLVDMCGHILIFLAQTTHNRSTPSTVKALHGSDDL
jgi:hypothetical protein